MKKISIRRNAQPPRHALSAREKLFGSDEKSLNDGKSAINKKNKNNGKKADDAENASANNFHLDLGLRQKETDAVVEDALKHAKNPDLKSFLKTLSPHEKYQFEARVMGYAIRIADLKEGLSSEETLAQAETLAARALWCVREYGTTVGTLKINEMLKERFQKNARKSEQ